MLPSALDSRELTPKNIQTQEERVTLVFAVNSTVDNRDGTLKPHMPADVYIATEGGAVRCVNGVFF